MPVHPPAKFVMSNEMSTLKEQFCFGYAHFSGFSTICHSHIRAVKKKNTHTQAKQKKRVPSLLAHFMQLVCF